ncbi:MAG: aminotransferase class I/II-fold pyridoxal phosphate-dependent enzyme [Actinobacteria bacterium]|nr:aminotransferase class I/II-fold pyridoxal phosphate-dependent enzyme [Actinomycetota bacterium]
MARRGAEGVSDFIFGNPHDMPLPEFSEALQKASVPQSKDWFAYKMSEPESLAVVSESLSRRYQMKFSDEDILMTNGAFAGLAVSLKAIVDDGDEVIYPIPPWFFYHPLIKSTGGVPVRVGVDKTTFDLDLEAIERAITSKTRAIIVNSPNNPTGKIYPRQTLQALSGLLSDASEKNGRTIYLLSDDAYCNIVFDGIEYRSPSLFYSNSILIYTYGKTLLTPGQRIGYLALNPDMADKGSVAAALYMAQTITGWAFPNADLQYALPSIETLSIDVAHLQERRDLMVERLSELGYQLHKPDGTFYLMVRSPLEDDEEFCYRLAEHGILVLPGALLDQPGYFRISLTANDEMIERSFSGFGSALASSG